MVQSLEKKLEGLSKEEIKSQIAIRGWMGAMENFGAKCTLSWENFLQRKGIDVSKYPPYNERMFKTLEEISEDIASALIRINAKKDARIAELEKEIAKLKDELDLIPNRKKLAAIQLGEMLTQAEIR